MSSVEQITLPLTAGERLSRDEFLRRWELLPNLKRAELIGGIVYVPSPLSIDHGEQDKTVVLWLGYFEIFTPGCRAASNATWLMGKDAPQPDAHLRILPEYGGQSGVLGRLAHGAPELVAEVCLSSASYDLGPKLNLYREAGVREYLTVLLNEPQVIWRNFGQGGESIIAPGTDGILRSIVFPGLWLDPAALLRGDGARILEVLNQGLATPEHRAFIENLQEARR